MKINHIREFLLLVSNRNFSKTAEQLYMAQSALSRHISSMEDELGVQLISRSTTTFSLTEEGEKAVDGVVFISPMANPSAYRDAADYSILEKQPPHSRVFKHESSRRYGFIVLLLK